MTFPWINLLPEIFLLIMTCVVLLASLFWEKMVYALSQLTLLSTAVLTFYNFNKVAVLFDGMFIQDRLTTLLKLFVFVATLFVFLYAKAFVPAIREKKKTIGSEYYLLGLFSVLGMMILISAGHLLTFFLGLEILSLPLYAMVALDRHSSIAAEAAMKYFVTGALATGLLLYGFSLVYGVTHSLSFMGIGQKIIVLKSAPHLILLVGLVFALAGVLFKLGATPFHMWIPDVYQGSTTPVTLFVAAAPKVAALGIIIRFLMLALPGLQTEMTGLLIVVSIASMMLGNFVAIVQTNLKRMLAYSSIAHVGYMLLGVIAGSADGYASAIFYVFAYSIMIAGALGVLALMNREGLSVENISDLQGLNTRSPWLAFIMLMMMFSMAGIPPLVGFFAKLGVLEALIQMHFIWLPTLALVFAIIGAYYYIAVVKVMYFEEPVSNEPVPLGINAYVAIIVNGLAVLFLGIFPSGLIQVCRQVMGI